MSAITSIQPSMISTVRPTPVLMTGNALPSDAAPAPLAAVPPAVAPEPKGDVPEQVARLQADLARLAPQTASLRFRVDPESDRVVVSIVDTETGDVLRQIPSDEALAIARSLSESGSGIVSDSA